MTKRGFRKDEHAASDSGRLFEQRVNALHLLCELAQELERKGACEE